jgi:pimeloyl-ACP methyl ester carboxylesterase
MSIARLGQDLCEVLEHVDVHDAVLAGHSMGGMTAQAFAIEHPDAFRARIRALVLVSTSSAGIGELALARLAPRVIALPIVNRLLGAPGGHVLVRGALGQGANPHAVALTRDTFLATTPDVRLSHLAAMGAMDLREGRAAIAVPTTVVVGSRDALTPPHMSREIAGDIAGAQLVEVPGGGHMLPLEAIELLVDLIQEAAR